MKLFIIFVFIIFTFLKLSAQNLVLNPSFEEYWFCPYVTSYDTFPCKHWLSPNQGTTDYLNACCKEVYFAVPDNACGHNPANTGNAYIGLVIIDPKNGWSEHIQGELSEPLKRERQYKVSFYVRFPFLASYFSTYSIGAHLSAKRVLTGNQQADTYLNSFLYRGLYSCNYFERITPDLKAHVGNPTGKYLEEENIWTEVSGYYTAKGGEKYITIGMFWVEDPKCNSIHNKYFHVSIPKYRKKLSKCLTNLTLKSNPKREREINMKFIQDFGCYYYIDDVSVTAVDSVEHEIHIPEQK